MPSALTNRPTYPIKSASPFRKARALSSFQEATSPPEVLPGTDPAMEALTANTESTLADLDTQMAAIGPPEQAPVAQKLYEGDAETDSIYGSVPYGSGWMDPGLGQDVGTAVKETSPMLGYDPGGSMIARDASPEATMEQGSGPGVGIHERNPALAENIVLGAGTALLGPVRTGVNLVRAGIKGYDKATDWMENRALDMAQKEAYGKDIDIETGAPLGYSPTLQEAQGSGGA